MILGGGAAGIYGEGNQVVFHSVVLRESKKSAALELGVAWASDPMPRLTDEVDAAIDHIGQATRGHTLKYLNPGGAVVTCGATSGPNSIADLIRRFLLQLRPWFDHRNEGRVRYLTQAGYGPELTSTCP